jgi:excisionase family DNA binding protein
MPTQTPIDPPPAHRLIDAREAARRYGCGWRTLYRLADRGSIPPGIRLGALRRWDAAAIDAHIAAGCPPLRREGRS